MNLVFLLITLCVFPPDALAKGQLVPASMAHKSDGSAVLQFMWPKADVSAKALVNGADIYIAFDQNAALRLGDLMRQFQKRFSLVDSSDTPCMIHLKGTQLYNIKADHDDRHWVFTLTPTTPKAQKKSPLPQKPKPKAKAALKEPSHPPSSALEVTTKHNAPLWVISFNWKEDAQMAAFWKGHEYWVFFDKDAPLDEEAFKDLLAQGLMKNITFHREQGTLLLRFTPSPDAYLNVVRAGRLWQLIFSDHEEPVLEALSLKVKKGREKGKEVFFDVENSSRNFILKDPTFLEEVMVVPLGRSGQAYPFEKEFLQFRTLAAHEGVALVPKDDRVFVDVTRHQIIIKTREGIVVSEHTPLSDALADSFESLLKFYDWEKVGKPWEVVRGDLLKAVHSTQGFSRLYAKIDLARFYLASSMEAEALVQLKAVKDDNPYLMNDLSFAALYAVALILDRQSEVATPLLLRPQFTNDPEMRVWRGMLAALKGDFKDALTDMTYAVVFAKTYPAHLQAMVLLVAAETQAERGHLTQARMTLDHLTKSTLSAAQIAHYTYIEGLLAREKGSLKEAQKLWSQAFEGGADHFLKSKAGLALINANLHSPKKDLNEEIKRLENLKYFWREGYIEYDILLKLAELYAQNNQINDAILTLKILKKHVTEKDKFETINTTQMKILEDLFILRFEKYPVLKGLSLYEDNKAFLEKSPQILAIQHKVADEYIKLHLMDRALGVLKDMEAHLPPDALFAHKMRQVAFLLVDNQPLRALTIIAHLKPTTADMQAQVRVMTAQAYFQAKQTDKALATLEHDTSVAADILRAHIFRAQENWDLAGGVFLKLAENHPSDAQHFGSYLTNAVICYTLAHNAEKRTFIFDRYKDQMQSTPQKELFNILVEDPHNQNLKTYVDNLEKFFSHYEEYIRELTH